MQQARAFSFVCRARAVLAAALLAGASLAAQAALVGFTGATDSGPLAGESFSGSFSHADPVAGFTGAVDLDQFELHFLGRLHALADADAAAVAWFDNGNFLGIDIRFAGALPAVQLVAGFLDVAEAHLAYDSSGAGVEGFGTVIFRAEQVVPEPGAAALALTAVLLLGAARRRRSRRP